MSKKNATWRQKWRGLQEFCHREKTIFDFKDRVKALLLLTLLTYMLYKLVELATN